MEDDFDSSANDPDDDYEIRRKTSNDANGSIAIVSTKTLYRNISDLQMLDFHRDRLQKKPCNY